MNRTLKEVLREQVLVSDGAMGTQLMAAGLEQGASGEMWNITHPELVFAIHRRYVDAGADCLTTNTFGGNGIILKRHQNLKDLVEINRAAARIARQVFGDKPGFVLGDVGPVGGVLEPYGDLRVEEVREAIRLQIQALLDGGVDAIIVETQTALEEAEIGVELARELEAPCIIASLAYDRSNDGTEFRTMMGVSPEEAATHLTSRGADVLALNCGTGVDMEAVARIIATYKQVTDCLTMAQPNAGVPVLENLKAVYKQSPDDMAASLDKVLAAGANIVGGCCGSTPDHIRAIRAKVDAWKKS